MLESELGKKTPLKKTEFLTGGPAGLLNYRCHSLGFARNRPDYPRDAPASRVEHELDHADY